MKTRKNFWASGVIALIWCALIVGLELFRYSNLFGWVFMVGPVVAFLMTYQVLRILQYIPDRLEKQETPQRSHKRVDQVLNQLNDTERELLRSRLAAEDYEPLADLLVDEHLKRKNR